MNRLIGSINLQTTYPPPPSFLHHKSPAPYTSTSGSASTSFNLVSSLGTQSTSYELGAMMRSFGFLNPLAGSTSARFTPGGCSSLKLASSRMKMRYTSLAARRWPAHILYPSPNVKSGASGFSSQRSGRKTSGSSHSSGSMWVSMGQLSVSSDVLVAGEAGH